MKDQLFSVALNKVFWVTLGVYRVWLEQIEIQIEIQIQNVFERIYLTIHSQ